MLKSLARKAHCPQLLRKVRVIKRVLTRNLRLTTTTDVVEFIEVFSSSCPNFVERIRRKVCHACNCVGSTPPSLSNFSKIGDVEVSSSPELWVMGISGFCWGFVWRFKAHSGRKLRGSFNSAVLMFFVCAMVSLLLLITR